MQADHVRPMGIPDGPHAPLNEKPRVRFRQMSRNLWSWELLATDETGDVVLAVAPFIFASLSAAKLNFLKAVWAVENREYEQEVISLN